MTDKEYRRAALKLLLMLIAGILFGALVAHVAIHLAR